MSRKWTQTSEVETERDDGLPAEVGGVGVGGNFSAFNAVSVPNFR